MYHEVCHCSTRDGILLAEICDLPLAEDIPITFNSVRKGPRSLDWRDDKPAELSWIETQASSCATASHSVPPILDKNSCRRSGWRSRF